MTDIETWRAGPARKRPACSEATRLRADAAALRTLPPLVFAGECDLLKARLAQVARGEAFVLQGGLHARAYGRDTADTIRDTLRTMVQMSALLTYATAVPLVKLSRIAHSADALPMIPRYQTSAAALNLVRAFASGGYGGLRQVHAWNSEFVADSPFRACYEPLTVQLGRALNFMSACGTRTDGPVEAEFFASHEARLLDYESALTRTDSRAGQLYNTASHFVWIGGRAGDLDSGFIDYLATIRNPIGIVLGPDTGPDDALASLDRLDPDREAGRLTFVVHMGAAAVRDMLPTVIQKVTAQGHQAAWICDAMHAGPPGRHGGPPAPRTFDDVLDEVTGFFEVHRELSTHPGGLHVEFAGRPTAGSAGLGLQRHERARHRPAGLPATPCLTRSGALDLAFLIADAYRNSARPTTTG